VRFVSAEPLLGSVDFTRICVSRAIYGDALRGWSTEGIKATLDWIIAGGESGPGARPCDVAWIRSIVEQCRAASVPCFVKQLGANPTNPKPATYADIVPKPRDRKGADPSEWPEDLRVQDFPAAMGR
jgi:protein gp37